MLKNGFKTKALIKRIVLFIWSKTIFFFSLILLLISKAKGCLGFTQLSSVPFQSQGAIF